MNPALVSGITGAAPMWNKLMTFMLAKTGSSAAQMMPDDVIKKYCTGQDRYFVKGTEKNVNCAAPPPPSGSPSPSIAQ